MAVERAKLVDDGRTRLLVLDGLSDIYRLLSEGEDVSVGDRDHREQRRDHSVGPGADLTANCLDHLYSCHSDSKRVWSLHILRHCLHNVILVGKVSQEVLALQFVEDFIDYLKKRLILGLVHHGRHSKILRQERGQAI